MKFFVLSLTLGSCALVANADTYQPATVTCPVGGEVIETYELTSCSTHGANMNLKRRGSCDFADQIQVCPETGLPLYKSFTRDEVESLTNVLASPEYESFKDKSTFQVSYGLAALMGDTISPLGFSIALRGWWYEPEAFVENRNFQDSFLREAEAELARASDTDAPFLAAGVAFAMAHAGRGDYADRWLREAESWLGDDTVAKSYVVAVKNCLRSLEQEGCKPDDQFVVE